MLARSLGVLSSSGKVLVRAPEALAVQAKRRSLGELLHAGVLGLDACLELQDLGLGELELELIQCTSDPRQEEAASPRCEDTVTLTPGIESSENFESFLEFLEFREFLRF